MLTFLLFLQNLSNVCCILLNVHQFFSGFSQNAAIWGKSKIAALAIYIKATLHVKVRLHVNEFTRNTCKKIKITCNRTYRIGTFSKINMHFCDFSNCVKTFSKRLQMSSFCFKTFRNQVYFLKHVFNETWDNTPKTLVRGCKKSKVFQK